MAKQGPIDIFRDDIDGIRQRIIKEVFEKFLREFFMKYLRKIDWRLFEELVLSRLRNTYMQAIKDAINKFVKAQPEYGHKGAVRHILITRLFNLLKQYARELLERMIKNKDIDKDIAPILRELLDEIYKALDKLFKEEILDILDELMADASPHHGDDLEPGMGGYSWPSIAIGSHLCGYLCETQDGKCKRRTSNPGYCYQHDKVSVATINKFKGNWKMGGYQVNVPRSAWEAALILRANRTLSWKETKGANVGAKREGRWTVCDGTLLMVYQAPNVGRVEWKAPHAAKDSMSGSYRTPEAGPQPAGWGGEWSAQKV